MVYSFFLRLGAVCNGLWQGLWVTWQHMWRSRTPVADNDCFRLGERTLQYPHERLPVPERGRYKLHNEIDDCIVCNKCVAVCPVDCIEIEAIKSPTILGKTSNGMVKRIYAARFDIDMAQCCFCGLCTTVCPTSCLTMTADYDYSVFDWAEHKVAFSTMTAEDISAARKQVAVALT